MTDFSEDEAVQKLQLMAADLKEAADDLQFADDPTDLAEYKARVHWIGQINKHIRFVVEEMKEHF